MIYSTAAERGKALDRPLACMPRQEQNAAGAVGRFGWGLANVGAKRGKRMLPGAKHRGPRPRFYLCFLGRHRMCFIYGISRVFPPGLGTRSYVHISSWPSQLPLQAVQSFGRPNASRAAPHAWTAPTMPSATRPVFTVARKSATILSQAPSGARAWVSRSARIST